MSRSRGFVSTLMRSARAVQRAQAASARAAARSQRQAEHARRVSERYRFAAAKEHKRIYAESRQAEVDDQNAELQQTVSALELILAVSLTRDCSIDLDTIKERFTEEPFQPGGLAYPQSVPELDDYLPP